MTKLIIEVTDFGIERVRIPVASYADEAIEARALYHKVAPGLDLLHALAQGLPDYAGTVPSLAENEV
ncbi:MAG TPA: hypothetical protein VGD60_11445 [Candidatus Acidoferrales bacterium]